MILVAGATGSLGGKVAHRLLEQGEAVRVLVRPASDATELEAAGAEVARGDLRDPATLADACRGVTTVVTTASATNRTDDTPENVDGRGTANLVDAARAAGVGHVIMVSTIGASPDSPVPAFRAKAAAEAHLRESGMDWTIVHCNAFMDVWLGMLVEAPASRGEPVTLVGEARRRHSLVAERDVAAFVVAAVRNPAARNAVLPVGGPEPISFVDAVKAYEAASGKAIPIRFVGPGEPIPGVPEPVWGFAAALESFDSPMPMEETARAYGVVQTTVQAHAAASALARRAP